MRAVSDGVWGVEWQVATLGHSICFKYELKAVSKTRWEEFKFNSISQNRFLTTTVRFATLPISGKPF